MGSLASNLCQTWSRLAQQSVLSSLSWLEEEKTCPCPPGAPICLGRWAFSFCVRSFRQADSRKADGRNSGTGNRPVGITLELDWDPSLWA